MLVRGGYRSAERGVGLRWKLNPRYGSNEANPAGSSLVSGELWDYWTRKQKLPHVDKEDCHVRYQCGRGDDSIPWRGRNRLFNSTTHSAGLNNFSRRLGCFFQDWNLDFHT